MKKLLISTIIGLLIFSFNFNNIYAGTTGPRKGNVIQEQIYPEYNGVFKESNVPYSLPDFHGKKHYWVRYWNASGYIDKEGKTHWDGVSYDGRFMYNPKVSKDGSVYFKLDELKDKENHYFRFYQVSQDPRLTNWWMSFAGDEYKNLFEAVKSGIFDEKNKHSEVVNAIINHMVSSGVVKKEELKSMSSKRIKKVIMDYTNIALTYNLQETRRVMKKTGKLITKDVFLNLKKSDTIQEFYWYRFGPYAAYREEYRITEIKGEGGGISKKVKILVKGTKEPNEVGWNDFFKHQKWMVLVNK